MQTSRDSSVWRSLAVAFGDGLAFAAGVKLTQSVTSRASEPVLPEATAAPLAERLEQRLEQMEKRLEQVEQTPAPVPAPPPPFDQKMLEAVVHALDSRLREQAAQVEHRLAELESKMAAELKTLRQQDHTIATAVESHLEKLQDHFIAQVEAVRQQVEDDRAAMHQEVAAAVAGASAGIIEERLAPLRSEAAEKDRQIAELRQRVETGDSAMLELLNGIGELIHQAASRKSPSPAPEAAAAPASPEPAQPQATAAESPVPPFASGQPGRLWRVPLVSSLVLAGGSVLGAALLHYF